jgi:hypothetical protein
MTLSSGLRRLATVVDELERANVRVHDAAVEPDAGDEGRVHATVALSFPVDSEPAGTEIGIEDGDREPETTRLDLGSEAADGEAANGDAPASKGATAITATLDRTESGRDEAIECPEPDCDATFESEPGMKVHRTKVHLSGATDADTPPAYRDPERLAAVYAAEDTFPEMRDALGADVSAQTVRRHMIRHGIHDPEAVPDEDERGRVESDDESVGDEVTVQEVVAADIAVPTGLQLDDLRAVVEAADTLYDVQQSFDIDRETARDLLAAFDLLELVHGRVATKRERDELKAEIDRRIDASLTVDPQ